MSNHPTLRRGSKGTAVKQVQIYLNENWGESLKVDGIFGPKTEAAVERMQKKAGIRQTGIVDSITWSHLDTRTAPPAPAPAPSSIAFQPTPSTEQGQTIYNDHPGYVFPVASGWALWVGAGSFGAPRDGGRRKHTGFDIGCPKGTPVLACTHGHIGVAGNDGGLGGNRIWLEGDDGKSYYYAHLLSFAVHQGAKVSEGQVIGYADNTGNAAHTATHLHFGIKVHGNWIDPYPSLLYWSQGQHNEPREDDGVGFDLLAPVREVVQSASQWIVDEYHAVLSAVNQQIELTASSLTNAYHNAADWLNHERKIAGDWINKEREAIERIIQRERDAVSKRITDHLQASGAWISDTYHSAADWLNRERAAAAAWIKEHYENTARWIGEERQAVGGHITGIVQGLENIAGTIWDEAITLGPRALSAIEKEFGTQSAQLTNFTRAVFMGPPGPMAGFVWDLAEGYRDKLIKGMQQGVAGDPYTQSSHAGVAWATASLLAGGIATASIVGDFVHPVKMLGLDRISAIIFEAAGFGPVIHGAVSPLAKAAIDTPMHHVANAYMRPNIPKADLVMEAWHKGIVTEHTVDTVLGFEGFNDGWSDLTKRMSYRPLRMHEITRLTDNIPMEEEDIREMLHYFSYNPKFIPMLAAALKKRSYLDEYKEILALAKGLYLDGIIENEELKRYLRFCNYAEDMVDLVVSLLDAKRYHEESKYVAKAVLTDYDNLVLSETEVRDKLFSMRFQPNWVNAQLRTHSYTRERKRQAALRAKTSPEAVRAYQIALREGILSEDDFRSAVKKLGLSDEKIEGLVLLDKYTKQGDLVKDTRDRDKALSEKLALKLVDAYALAFRHNYFDENEFRARLKDSGLDQAKIESFVNSEKVVKAYQLHDIVENKTDQESARTGDILEQSYRLAFRSAQIDEAELRRLLREISIPDRKIDAIVRYELTGKGAKVALESERKAESETEEVRRELRKAFTLAFRAGRIDSNELSGRLTQAGYSAAAVSAIVEQEKIMRESNISEASAKFEAATEKEVNNILKKAWSNAFRHYLIDEEAFRSQLASLGLIDSEIDAIVLQETIAQESAIQPSGEVVN